MSITASQLVAEVSANGADTTEEQLLAVSEASDRVAASFAEMASAASESFTEMADTANMDFADIEEQASAASESIGMVADSAAESSGGFLSSIGSMGGGMLDLLGKAGMAAMGVQMFGQMAVQMGGMLIGPDAEMEQMQISFTTLMHSSSAAKDELQQLSNFAAKTPFQLMDLDAAGAKLLAFGEKSKELIPDLTSIGDALAALGETTPARLGMIVDIFGKIDTTGKLTGGIMMQLSRDGINGWQALADASGKTIPVLQEMVKKGLIPASEATQWLRTGLEKMYGGGMAQQALTFNGLLSTFKDNILAAWRAFSGPLFDMAKSGLEQLGNLVASPAFQNFAVTAGQVLADALSRVGSLVSWVIRQFETWANLLANNPTWQLFISEVIDGWNSVMDAFSGFGTWISSMWPSVMQVIQVAWADTIGVITEGVTWIVNEIHDFAGQWNTIWAAIQNNPSVQGLEAGLVSAFTKIKDAASAVFSWFQTEIPKVPAWFLQTWQAIQNNPIFKSLEGLAISVFTGIENAALKAQTWIQQHWGDITAFVQGKLQDLQKIAAPILEQIGKKVEDAWANVQPKVSPVLDWLAQNWQNIPSMIIQGMQEIANDPHLQIFLKALQDAGTWIAQQFAPVWAQLALTLQTQLIPAWDHLQQALGPIMPSLQQLGLLLAGVFAVCLGLVVGLISAFIGGLANFLTGAIEFIGGIIQIFSGLIEFFVGMWLFLQDLFTGNWSRLGQDLSDMGHGITDIVMGLFNVIVGFLMMTVGYVFGFVKGFVTGIIGFFTFLWDALVGHSIIPDMVNGILQWFSNLVAQGQAFFTNLVTGILTRMVQMEIRVLATITEMVTIFLSWLDKMTGGAVTKAQSVVSGITGVLGNLGSLALKWGQDMMNGLTTGIQSKLGDLGHSVQGVAGTISSWLHFSKPDIGPLKDADTWMPDFTDLLSRGLHAGIPKLHAAMGDLAMPLTVMAAQNHASSASIAVSPVSMPTSGNSQPFVIQLQMPDGDTFAEYMVDPVMRRVMRTTNRKSGRRGL